MRPAAPATVTAVVQAVTAPAADTSTIVLIDPDEKAALAKKIGAGKKPISTKELAEKFEVPTWQVRRAINEILVPEGKGAVEKTGNVLTYTPA